MNATAARLLREDPFLACRRGARGHLWEDQPLPRRRSFGQAHDARCVECTKERHRIVDALGQIAAQWYTDPDGYRLDFPYDTNDVRLAYLAKLRAEQRAS